MTYEKLIQVIEECRDAEEARAILRGLEFQSGYLYGRTLPAGYGKPDRVQAFFELDGHDFGDWLPDGMKVVLCPSNLFKRED